MTKCKLCSGSGVTVVQDETSLKLFEECEVCLGNGYVWREECETCNGNP